MNALSIAVFILHSYQKILLAEIVWQILVKDMAAVSNSESSALLTSMSSPQWRKYGWNYGGRRVDPEGLLVVCVGRGYPFPPREGCGEEAMPLPPK